MTKKEQLLKCGFVEDPSTDGTVDLYLSVRGDFRNSRDKEGAEICGLRLRADWENFTEDDEYEVIEVTIFDNSGYEVIMGEI